MKKIHKILIPVFSVLLIASVILLILTSNGTLTKRDLTSSENSGTFKGEDFTSLGSSSVLTAAPLMKTDFDSVYYSLSSQGEVKFYEYNGTSFSPYSGEVKSVQLKPEMTYYKIPVTVYYIEKDGKVSGYGLFTKDKADNINLYSYLFAHLTDAPTVYGLKGNKLLLISTDSGKAYSADKVYSEMFSVDLDKSSCNAIFPNRDRTADKKTGRLSERWSMITDSYLASVSKRGGVISGRLYDAGTKKFDVFDISKNMNSPLTKGIFGTYLREGKDGSIIYLKKTSDGFKSVSFITEEKTIKEIKCDSDFIISGDWIYSKSEGTFTNILTGDEIVSKKTENIDMFAASPDGEKIVAVASYTNQAFFVIDKNGSTKGYAGEEIFNSDVNNICFADNDTVLTTFVTSDGACKNLLTKVK